MAYIKYILYEYMQLQTQILYLTYAIRCSYKKIAKSWKKISCFSFLKKKIVFANVNTFSFHKFKKELILSSLRKDDRG